MWFASMGASSNWKNDHPPLSAVTTTSGTVRKCFSGLSLDGNKPRDRLEQNSKSWRCNGPIFSKLTHQDDGARIVRECLTAISGGERLKIKRLFMNCNEFDISYDCFDFND